MATGALGLPPGFELEPPQGFQMEGPQGAPQPMQMNPMQARMGIRGMRAGQGANDLHSNVGGAIGNLGYNVGGGVTDLAANAGLSPETSAKLGYGANVATDILPMAAGGVAGGISKIPELSQALAKRIMQSAVKPSMADRLSGASDRAISTMLSEGINATRGGMDKAGKIAGNLDQEVQAAIAASPESVNVAQVGSRLRDPYTKAINQVNPESDVNAVRGAWDSFRNSPHIQGHTEIPVQLAQELKSGTYRALGGKAYGEVGSMSTEAQKALARGLREEIAAKVPSVVEPLKREAGLWNVKDVAMNRVMQDANNNPLGLAALRVDNPLAATTFMADKSALFKSLLARMLNAQSKAIPASAGRTAGAVYGAGMAKPDQGE